MREILIQFICSEDGLSVLRCPEGHTPKAVLISTRPISFEVLFRDAVARTVCIKRNAT